MIDNPKISIIMPVYNAEQFVGDTIQSILDQSYGNFELLIIDDGSTDRSGTICEEYAEKDERVVVEHKVNGGICNARNEGLKRAKGEYITFCDNDDLFHKDLLLKTVEYADKHNAEMVRFRRMHSLDFGKVRIKGTYPKFRDYHTTIEDWNTYIDLINQCGYGVWAGIYRRDFIENNNIKFDESIRYGMEDHIFVAQCFLYANVVGAISDILYEWKQRSKGSTSKIVNIEALNNRFTGIFRWISIEEQISSKLHASINYKNNRIIDYLTIMVDEVGEKALRHSEAQRLLSNGIEYLNLKSVDPSILTVKNRLYRKTIITKKYRIYFFIKNCGKVGKVISSAIGQIMEEK